jgi:hypothetical protein
MTQLDLEKIWKICNKLALAQEELADKDIWVNFLGRNSNYSELEFEHFLETYSFRVRKDDVMIFLDEPVPYEDYNYEDFNYVPFSLIFGGEKELEEYIKTETETQLEQQRKEKDYEKERLKLQIEQLTRQLNNL